MPLGRYSVQLTLILNVYNGFPDRSQGPVPSSKTKAAEHVWGCPKCREEYAAAEAPSEYRCMCGAELDPLFNPWLLPHTCGSICRRPLHPHCGHSCFLLCHPGACPPCAAKVTQPAPWSFTIHGLPFPGPGIGDLDNGDPWMVTRDW